MDVTFIHEGHSEDGGNTYVGGGETYRAGEYTVWFDPTGAVYLTVEGLHLESDYLGERVRIWTDEDSDDVIDIDWRDIGHLLDWGDPLPTSGMLNNKVQYAHAVPALTAMLVHAHIIRAVRNRESQLA